MVNYRVLAKCTMIGGTITTAILLATVLPYPLRLILISILLTGIFTGSAYLAYLWFKIWKAWSR